MGSQADEPLLQRQRFGKERHPSQRAGLVVQCIGMRSVDLERSRESDERLSRPICRQTHDTQIIPGVGVGGLPSQRSRHQLVGGVELAPTKFRETEIVQSLRIVRLLGEQAAISPLGLLEPALAQQSDAGFDLGAHRTVFS